MLDNIGSTLQKARENAIKAINTESSKSQTPSGILLSWSHYTELLTVSDDLAMSFYEKQSIKENWSFREEIIDSE